MLQQFSFGRINPLRILLLSTLMFVAGVSPMSGSTLLFATPPGAKSGGQAVDASALFNFSNGSFTVTLTNLGVTNDAGQLLSDLLFKVSASGPITLTGMSSHTVDVRPNGDLSNVNAADTSIHWAFGTDNSNGEYLLCVVCGAGVTSPNQQQYEILGPGGSSGSHPYSTSDSTIKGNGANQNEPFILDSATFTFTGASIKANTTVNNVFFSFGGTFGSEVSGSQAPEPMSVILTGAGLLALAGLRRFRKAV
jgi:hypothetical protein